MTGLQINYECIVINLKKNEGLYKYNIYANLFPYPVSLQGEHLGGRGQLGLGISRDNERVGWELCMYCHKFKTNEG